MDQVEEIKRKTDIIALIGEYVDLKKAGRNFRGLCPFHGEKTPSFMVSEELGIFRCFGCGKGGDVYKFVMEIEGLEFVEALEKLADKAGVKLVHKKGESRSEKQKLYDVCSLTSEYYHFLLVKHKAGKQCLEYLIQRGVEVKLAEKFKLGYSLDSWDGLKQYLIDKKGFKEEVLEKAGLVLRSEKGRTYDRFRGRLIFPFYDMSGRVVGFSGRELPGAKDSGGGAKYINSPETLIYHKSKVLFGLEQARESIRKKGRVVLVEGPMDAISSYAAGVGETVASNGTAVTEEMIGVAARLADKLVLAMDADEAGYAAIKKVIRLAEDNNLITKVVSLEGGKDPDEIARKSPKKWKLMVDKAVEIYEFVMLAALAKYGSSGAEAKRKVSEEVIPFLTEISNKVVQAHWVAKLARSLRVEDKGVWEEMARWEKRAVTGQKKPVETQKKEEKLRRSRLEELTLSLVALLLEVGEVEKEKVKEVLVGVTLEARSGRLIKKLLTSKRGVKVEKFINSLPADLKDLAQEAYLIEVDRNEAEKRLLRMADELRVEWLRLRKKELSGQIAQLEKAGKKVELKRVVEEFMRLLGKKAL